VRCVASASSHGIRSFSRPFRQRYNDRQTIAIAHEGPPASPNGILDQGKSSAPGRQMSRQWLSRFDQANGNTEKEQP
jgi:hypothetical protein